ncbi:hypothetical protein [Mangrovicoccus ximenensis]|uniref:hypothetical protein n=1 Tax=Mangrovicoccus ximenensis TaxID=1911570 RepID=UPI0011AE26D0|nr:hypothetical protein [Mangrovicoccus ximenensis]
MRQVRAQKDMCTYDICFVHKCTKTSAPSAFPMERGRPCTAECGCSAGNAGSCGRACARAGRPPDPAAGVRAVRRSDDLLELRDALFAWRIADRLPGLACPLRLLNSAAVEAAHGRDPLPCLADVPRRIYGRGHFPQIADPAALLPVLCAELAEIDTTTPIRYTAADGSHIP